MQVNLVFTKSEEEKITSYIYRLRITLTHKQFKFKTKNRAED